MKCLILAAGYATRLYPLTENFPKPLLKVGEKTILDWLIDDIDSGGLVDGYVVISNHKFAPIFEDWAKDKQKITVLDDGTSSNETRLGAVRDIQYAIDMLGLDEDLLVIAGDNVLDFSLVRFIEYAREKGTSCIMRYYEPSEEKLHKTGVATVDATWTPLAVSSPGFPRRPRSMPGKCPAGATISAISPPTKRSSGPTTAFYNPRACVNARFFVPLRAYSEKVI